MGPTSVLILIFNHLATQTFITLVIIFIKSYFCLYPVKFSCSLSLFQIHFFLSVLYLSVSDLLFILMPFFLQLFSSTSPILLCVHCVPVISYIHAHSPFYSLYHHLSSSLSVIHLFFIPILYYKVIFLICVIFLIFYISVFGLFCLFYLYPYFMSAFLSAFLFFFCLSHWPLFSTSQLPTCGTCSYLDLGLYTLIFFKFLCRHKQCIYSQKKC